MASLVTFESRQKGISKNINDPGIANIVTVFLDSESRCLQSPSTGPIAFYTNDARTRVLRNCPSMDHLILMSRRRAT